MGMIANYQILSDENLKELKSFKEEADELLEIIEEWEEEAETFVSIDKMWDVLHFMLTGVDSCTQLENNPLRQAIVGVSSIDDLEEQIAYTEKSKVAEIVSALENFDIEKAMENFSMQKCKEAKLYPNIWDYEDEAEEIKEDIIDCFQRLKDFYKKVLEKNGNVLVTIY